MVDITKAKLLHYSFPYDYWQNGIGKENQVNQLINYLINKFIVDYEKNYKGKFIILEFQNDVLSLITYNFLKNIQSVYDIPLLIVGKHQLLKKYLKSLKKNQNKKKEKFISDFKAKRLLEKEQAILISCYNPIYQVENTSKNFNKFKNTFNLVERITPEEISIIKGFYSLDNFDEINWDLFKQFNKFCNGEEIFGIEDFNLFYPQEIFVIKMTGDNEIDNQNVNEAVDTEGLIFYDCEKDYHEYPILISEYQYYLKKKTNIPGYWNINTYSIVKNLGELGIPINYIGDVDERRWEDAD